MSEPTRVRTAYVLIGVAAGLFGLPLIIATHIFRVYRNTIPVQKRNFEVTLVTLIFLNLFIFVFIPAQLLLRGKPYGFLYLWARIPTFEVIFRLCFASVIWGITCSFFLRVWLHRYKIKLVNQFLENKWRNFIRPTRMSDAGSRPSTWYLDNRHAYGDGVWMGKRFVLVWILLTTFNVLIATLEIQAAYRTRGTILQFYTATYELACLGIFVVLYVWAWWTTPKFDDRFEIQHELSYTLGLFAFGWIATLAAQPMWAGAIVSVWVIVVCGSFSNAGVGLILGLYHLKFNRDDFDSFLRCCRRPRLSLFSTSSEPSELSSRELSINAYDCIPLIFANETSLNKLVYKCMREFTHENVLFTIEVMQFKNFLIKKHNIMEDKCGKHFEVARNNIPESSIVVDGSKSDHEKSIALTEKYVHEDSRLQVNLSHGTRVRTISDVEDAESIDSHTLVVVFDRAIAEILGLLKQSVDRNDLASTILPHHEDE